MKAQIFSLIVLSMFCLKNITAQLIWQQKANKPTKSMCCGVTLNGKIYVSQFDASNHITIEEYDPKTDTWRAKKGKSNSQNQGVYCFTATASRIYIMGGYWANGESKVIEEYDPVLDTFIVKREMPIAIDCASASSLNGKIYLFGGSTLNAYSGTNATYEYDPVTETWLRKKDAPNMRREHYSLTIDRKIYTWGGLSGNNKANCLDVYDPSTDTWSAGTTNIEPGKWGFGMGYAKGAIYLMLGTTINRNGAPELTKEEIVKYDLTTGTSTLVETKQNAIWFNSIVSYNDSIYLIGGMKGLFPTGPLQNCTEVFTPVVTTGTGSLQNSKDRFSLNVKYNGLAKTIEVTVDELNYAKAQVTITGSEGKVWYSCLHSNNHLPIKINTGGLPNGLYVVTFNANRFVVSRKIILTS